MFFLGVRRLADSRLAELDRIKQRFFVDDDVERIEGKELLTLARRGQVVVLDVRPTLEYEAAHIAGAISIPHNELKRRLSELPKNRKIVAYCRGPFCVYAVEAVKTLRARGFKAARIEDGVLDWRARGLPVEVATAEVPT